MHIVHLSSLECLLYLGNEWKTRFETQEEMNQQLERQLIMLQDKVEEAKRNLKDGELFRLEINHNCHSVLLCTLSGNIVPSHYVNKSIYHVYRGSYRSAHVLLNLLNELGDILSFFRNELYKFNNARA